MKVSNMTVSLRAMTEGHVPQIVAACGDWEELARYGPPYWRPRSAAELKRKIATMAGPEHGNEYTFVVESLAGRLVGECSVHGIDWRNGLAQVGICIWSPDDRGKGLGLSAVQRVIHWA